MYLYLPWVMVFVAMALLAPRVGYPRTSSTDAIDKALPMRTRERVLVAGD
jgi:hypothetical protein